MGVPDTGPREQPSRSNHACTAGQPQQVDNAILTHDILITPNTQQLDNASVPACPSTSAIRCATRRRIVFLAELGGTGGMFLGLMAYLDPKGDKGR